jgi:hypothetical protein
MTAWWTRSRAVLSAVVCLAALGTGCGIVRSPNVKTTPPTPTTSSTTVNSPTPSTSATSSGPSTRQSAAPPYPGCRTGGDPRAGVNTPLRLIVRSPCIRVRGIAGCIFVDEGDGDTHIALLLDATAGAKYLTPGNKSWTCDSDQGSDTAPRLVIEVIPQHCVVRPDNCADRGHFTDPQIPKNGQSITVTGPWVQDTSTKEGRTLWSEIHPAWRITIDEGNGVPVQGNHNYSKEGD